MDQVKSAGKPIESHVLQCMEIWNGNQFVENKITATGLRAWIYSQPYEGESRGGDVHYLSLCVGGIITRLVLADVAGHGELVAATSQALRNLLRRFMNVKRQDRLVAELNREFTQNEVDGRFATAIVATYLSNKRKLLLTNAGHPRPLRYSQATGLWAYLDNSTLPVPSRGGNFPLGLIDDSSYEHFEIDIQANDWLLLYTDALSEAMSPSEELLGEKGLLEIVKQLDVKQEPEELGRKLLESVSQYSLGLGADDTTIIALKFDTNHRTPGVVEKLRAYTKLITGA